MVERKLRSLTSSWDGSSFFKEKEEGTMAVSGSTGASNLALSGRSLPSYIALQDFQKLRWKNSGVYQALVSRREGNFQQRYYSENKNQVTSQNSSQTSYSTSIEKDTHGGNEQLSVRDGFESFDLTITAGKMNSAAWKPLKFHENLLRTTV